MLRPRAIPSPGWARNNPEEKDTKSPDHPPGHVSESEMRSPKGRGFLSSGLERWNRWGPASFPSDGCPRNSTLDLDYISRKVTEKIPQVPNSEKKKKNFIRRHPVLMKFRRTHLQIVLHRGEACACLAEATSALKGPGQGSPHAHGRGWSSQLFPGRPRCCRNDSSHYIFLFFH